MTKLLEKAFKEAAKLPLEEQRALAKRLLQELGEREHRYEAGRVKKRIKVGTESSNRFRNKQLVDEPATGLRNFFQFSDSQSARVFRDKGTSVLSTIGILYEIKKSLEALLKPDKIDEWLAMPNPSLDGETPRDVIASGDAARVLDELAAVEWGGHI